eukprot:6177909-Pleurochrysis_carterae.AAC.2
MRQRVFEGLIAAGMALMPSKSQFMRKELEALGYIVTRDGMRPNPEQVEALHKMPDKLKDKKGSAAGSDRGSGLTGLWHRSSRKKSDELHWAMGFDSGSFTDRGLTQGLPVNYGRWVLSQFVVMSPRANHDLPSISRRDAMHDA